MVVIRRPIRQLKDTFQCTRSHDEIRQQQQITGRHVLSAKKLLYLPSNCDSNYNMNFNEIPLPPPLLPSLITKKQQTNNDEHDLQQSKLKNMVIDELKSFFVSRNQNHQQQNDRRNSEINIQLEAPILTGKSSIQQTKQINSSSSKKQIIQCTVNSKQVIPNKEQLTNLIISKTIHNSERSLSIPSTFVTASTTLLVSLSLLTNILLNNDLIRSSKKFSNLLNLLSDNLFYSTSFIFGCFGAQFIKQTKLSYIHRFGNILIRSLLLHTSLTLLAGDKSFSQRRLSIPTGIKTISNSFLFTRQDIFIRIVTSILHLIAGFTSHFEDKNML